MSEQLPFHSTPIGRKYYEETLPNLIKSLNELGEALEKRRCHWLGCEEPSKPSFISLPGGAALKVCLCEKHTKRVVKVLGSSIVIVRPPGQKEKSEKKCPTCGLPKDLCVCTEFTKEEMRIPTPPESLTEAEKQLVDMANEKLRAKVTPAAKDDEQPTIPTPGMPPPDEEEKKKKDDELGRVARELATIDVEIADFAKKIAIKKRTRVILERRGQILANEISGEEVKSDCEQYSICLTSVDWRPSHCKDCEQYRPVNRG